MPKCKLSKKEKEDIRFIVLVLLSIVIAAILGYALGSHGEIVLTEEGQKMVEDGTAPIDLESLTEK